MGVVPILVRADDRRLFVSGMATSGDREISETEVDDLRQDGNLIWLDTPIPLVQATPLAAWWVGSRFAAEAKRLDAPIPPIANSGRVPIHGHGIASLRVPSDAFRNIEGWVRRASRAAIVRNDPALARLTAWVLPDSIHSRAAIWKTSPASEQKLELSWHVRRERDSGRRTMSDDLRGQLLRHCQLLQEEAYPFILAVTGPAESAHKILSQEIAAALKVPRLSFSDLIRQEVARRRLTDTRESMQEVGQELVSRNPLGLSERLLSSKGSEHVVVVDSVRHTNIVRALQYLAGTRQHILLFGTTIDARTQLERLRQDPTVDNPEHALHHATEREIRPILRMAQYIVTSDANKSAFKTEVRNAVEIAKEAVSAAIAAEA